MSHGLSQQQLQAQGCHVLPSPSHHPVASDDGRADGDGQRNTWQAAMARAFRVTMRGVMNRVVFVSRTLSH
ncbi:hypothetical protein CI238_09022 [Colletotrichum incanum]|uniref:Uncharacterized protein n=1 Tax=Colletotrichum incanum TaxID=1573173 RepID=A0A166MMA1_COLIC|nr:hypothetical protein CI238_09022 [Colletotrichum incanum]